MTPRGEFFDYDSLTGLTEYYEETPDGKTHIHTYQDVGPILDHCKALANEGLTDDAWTKQGVAVYAKLPLVVLGQMAKKGIRFFDPNHVGKVVQEVNENYPWLKTTYKHHQA